jgi:molybdopterin-guanine dinucleotide biosynthesis protein A
MGADKALLSFGKGPQVQRVAGMLERLCPPVFVSVRRGQLAEPALAGLNLLPDQEEGVGPLEGLLSAFRKDPHTAWLAVAVDMPYLTEATLRRLLEKRDASVFATVFRNPQTNRPEPVCAIYEPRILPVLRAAKEKRRYSLMLLRDVPVRLVEPVSTDDLRNVNDPEEYRRAGGVSSLPAP